ncbi:Peptidoglycan-recognition protein LC, partial [Pseudolycoriella hygida]
MVKNQWRPTENGVENKGFQASNRDISGANGNDIKSSEYGSSLRFISRSEWLAQPPNADLNDLELPSQRIIIAHTATENCTNQATCTFRVRYIQTFHMESQGWDDIGYNFLVGGDGAVYEGRGWDKEGAHTK